MNDPKKGTILSDYQPITCHCTTWKLLLGIIVAKMSRAQKGVDSDTKGANHQLLVVRAVIRDDTDQED